MTPRVSGLAGPQVGISLRLFVFDDGVTGPSFMANPELLWAEGEIVEEEGCLSIPGPFHPTRRFASDHMPGPEPRRRSGRDVGRGAARQDLPARDRPPRRNAVHRSTERGWSQGRPGRAPPDRARDRRASPTASRRRGVGDACAHPGGVHGQRRVVGPDAGTTRSSERRRRGVGRDEPAAARGTRVEAHADVRRGGRSPAVAPARGDRDDARRAVRGAAPRPRARRRRSSSPTASCSRATCCTHPSSAR